MPSAHSSGSRPSPCREPLDGRRRRGGVELDRAGQRRPGAEQAEHDVRVRDGRLAAAVPVGRRSRPRAGRARPDAQRATGVGPGDRPAAGADGVQVEHRQRDRAPADEASGRLPRGAVLDHADVARRAAHVEAQRAALAARERRPGGAGRAARGPGEHRQGGMVARLLERGEAAGGLHHVRRRQARVSRARGDRRQVVGQQRRERRIELGRRGALVLAERAHDLVRERDVHVRAAALAAPRPAPARAPGGGRSAAGRRPPQPAPARRRHRRARPGPRARAARRRAPCARARRSAAPVGRAAPDARRRGGRGRRAPGARARRGPRSPRSRRAPCALRGPRAARWSRRSCRARRRGRPALALPPAPARRRRRRARPRTGPPAWSAPWR